MDINELQRIANKYLRDEEEEVPSNIIEDLKQKLSADSIGIAQINPKQGDIDYNYKKIAQYIIHAQNIGLKLIVFPEMSLLGYPLNDTLKRHPYIANNCLKRLEELAQYAANTTALVGFVEPDEITPNNNTFFSSLAVLSGGKVKDIIRRSTLLSGFDTKDYKYISPSLFENYKLHNTLVTIGDGCFSDIDLSGVSAIINCSARSAREEAHYSIHNKLSELSEKYNVQIMYANQTGASDSVIFEGSSRFYNTKGEVTVLAEPFEEGLLIVNPKDDENKPAIEFKNAPIEQTSFSFDYEYDLE